MGRFGPALAVVAAWFAVASAAPVPPTPAPPDWRGAIREREFQFDKAQEGIEASIRAAKKGGAEVAIDGDFTRGEVEVRISQGGKPVVLLAHARAAFAVRGGVLYFAVFSPYANGCSVAAYDLKTGKKLWTQSVQGIGPIPHFAYQNRVILAVEKHPTADAWAVVVTGWESAGRYVEVLDPRTGKQLANKTFDGPREKVAPGK
jgi:hypothetical protein